MRNRAATNRKKRNHTPSARQQLLATRHRCPKISRSRLRTVTHELQDTRNALNKTLSSYWQTPESDVRGRLQHTERLIGRVVSVLTKAA